MRMNRSRTSSANSTESESVDDHEEEERREGDKTTSDGLVTYYTVLQVPENAKAIDIRKAYLRLVLTSHPDRIGSNVDPDALAFRTIKDAYDVLSNEAKRREYDMKLHQIRNPPMPETYIQGGHRDLHHFPMRHHAVYRTQQSYYIPTRPTPISIPAPATLFARSISFQILIRPVVPPLRMQIPIRPIFTPPNPFPIPVRPRFRRSMTSMYM